MNRLDSHPVVGQLNETQRRSKSVEQIQAALAERRRVMERDGKLTTIAAGFIGLSALFFMNPLPFYLILAMMIVGLPMVWRHLVKEAREFTITDDELKTLIEEE